MPEPTEAVPTQAEWVEAVEAHGRSLCSTVQRATEAGVPDALILPALIGVFREAGMLPDMDFTSLLGMFK